MDNYSILDLRKLDEAVMERPIVTSLLGDDFYKFAMGNFIHDYPEYRNAIMDWNFKNRTKSVPLANFINERDFMDEYIHVKNLSANNTDLHYLRGTNEYETRMFSEQYLELLYNLKFPMLILKLMTIN